MRTIELIAHRGAGKDWQQSQSPPENTLPALQAAWGDGLRACELDIRLTGDGHLLVIHDATTARTTDGERVVADSTLAALQALDAGSWKHPRWAGTRLPTLAAVLAAMPADGRLYIELKTGPRGVVERLAADIAASGVGAERLAVISFVWESALAARRALPDVPSYLLVEFRWDPVRLVWDAGWAESPDGVTARPVWRRAVRAEDLIAEVQAAGLSGLDVSAAQPPDFAAAMARAGLPWVAWTLSDPQEAVEMAHRGAAGLTTDQPDRIRAALRRAGFETR